MALGTKWPCLRATALSSRASHSRVKWALQDSHQIARCNTCAPLAGRPTPTYTTLAMLREFRSHLLANTASCGCARLRYLKSLWQVLNSHHGLHAHLHFHSYHTCLRHNLQEHATLWCICSTQQNKPSSKNRVASPTNNAAILHMKRSPSGVSTGTS